MIEGNECSEKLFQVSTPRNQIKARQKCAMRTFYRIFRIHNGYTRFFKLSLTTVSFVSFRVTGETGDAELLAPTLQYHDGCTILTELALKRFNWLWVDWCFIDLVRIHWSNRASIQLFTKSIIFAGHPR